MLGKWKEGATKETTIAEILYMHDTFKTGSPLFKFADCFAAATIYAHATIPVGDFSKFS